LGLAISQAIARAHGGDLTYARDAGVTRLELTLPEGDWRGDAQAAPAMARGAG
jgi:signal transduction histidine kinase